MPTTRQTCGTAKRPEDLQPTRLLAAIVRAAAAIVVEVPVCLDSEDGVRATELMHLSIASALTSDRVIDARCLGYALAGFGAAIGEQENHGSHADQEHSNRPHRHALRALELAVKILRLYEPAAG